MKLYYTNVIKVNDNSHNAVVVVAMQKLLQKFRFILYIFLRTNLPTKFIIQATVEFCKRIITVSHDQTDDIFHDFFFI